MQRLSQQGTWMPQSAEVAVRSLGKNPSFCSWAQARTSTLLSAAEMEVTPPTTTPGRFSEDPLLWARALWGPEMQSGAEPQGAGVAAGMGGCLTLCSPRVLSHRPCGFLRLGCLQSTCSE